eukprot:scaffold23796_cov144-Isochrysis_galbana.AAC.6
MQCACESERACARGCPAQSTPRGDGCQTGACECRRRLHPGRCERYRVEVVVFETVILEQHARVGVYVWVRVLGLAVLGQHTRHHLVH